MVQATTIGQAIQAADRGVDVIIAQGSEAGCYTGSISTMALVPQAVDAVSPIPVVAAGGIYDGRGIAAAFMLGAVGVNIGTRFLASKEAPLTTIGSEQSSRTLAERGFAFHRPDPLVVSHFEISADRRGLWGPRFFGSF